MKSIKIKTVGELKTFLENVPNDMPLLIYRSNAEKSGYCNSMYIEIAPMKEEVCRAYDLFDGDSYDYITYVNAEDSNGILHLCFD